MKKHFRRTVSAFVACVIVCLMLINPAFASGQPNNVLIDRPSSSVHVESGNVEGYHGWNSLTEALNYYGATFAVYVGIYYDTVVGKYYRYYINMDSFRIYFGVRAYI